MDIVQEYKVIIKQGHYILFIHEYTEDKYLMYLVLSENKKPVQFTQQCTKINEKKEILGWEFKIK